VVLLVIGVAALAVLEIARLACTYAARRAARA
jgi:hypothetical protein